MATFHAPSPRAGTPVFPARLHVLLARGTRDAVVIRRGPSRHTAVIGWDRATDRFTLGQWFYGRIYERRSDLSPDGRHLLYFATNGRWQSAAKGSWTAISRAPWLRALSLFAKGDCWHGGGLFLSAREYWLNDGYGHEVRCDNSRLKRSTAYPWHEAYGGECPGVYFIRLQKDGWGMKHIAPDGAGGQVTLFEKPATGHWRLRKLAHATIHRSQGRSVYYDTHELFNARTGAVERRDDWEWADVDGERLVWAARGRLHAGEFDRKGLADTAMLHDFNDMKFERREAPYP
jgi:hypothetical protein